MPIRTTRDPGTDLTIHEVTGPADEAEMYSALQGDGADSQTALVLWDMTRAEVAHVTPEILRRFIRKAADLGQARRGGRTAVVAADDLAYGLARMSEALSDLAESPYSLQAFRSRGEAMVWLNGEESDA